MGTLRHQVGYTIVEVSLFMAISGLLLSIAIVGTANTIRTFRFTDSGRSLSAFVQKQYDNVLNGVNSRTTPLACENSIVGSGTAKNPGTGNCLLMGKLLLFSQNSAVIKTYDIVGTEPSNADYSRTDEQLISDFTPKIVTTPGNSSYNIAWGAYISGIKRSDAQATNALALVRSPRSTRIVPYSYKEAGSDPTIDLTTVVNTAAGNAGKVVNYCIKNADGLGAPAKMVIGTGGNQGAAQIIFDTVETDCNGT